MDSITQAALGGVIGELTLGRKLGWKGMAWGLFFGTLPDLDIIFYPFLDEAERLRWHRGLSHSIVMMVVAALVCAKPLAWLHRERGVTARQAGWFVFWVWSTHVLIDVFTTYGTQVFEPFSDRRVAWNNLFIIDLLFSLPLIICVLAWPWRALRHAWERWQWKREDEEDREEDEEPEFPEFSTRPARLALTLSSLYVLFSFIMKFWATHQIEDQMEDSVQAGKLVAVAPTPFNTLLWRGLIETEKGYFVTYWSPFDDGPSSYDYFPKRRELAEKFEGQKLFESLTWFSRGHWVAHPGENGAVFLSDLRFGEVRQLEEGRLIPFFQWRMRYDENGKMEAPQHRPHRPDVSQSLINLGRRILGRRQEWEDVKTF